MIGKFAKLKGLVIPLVAAFLMSAGAVGCSSTDESQAPDAALTEKENGAPAENAAAAENGASPANPSNAAGNELQNLVSESSPETAAAPMGDGNLNPANDAGGGAPPNGADPFAAAPAPANDLGAAAAPTDPALANPAMNTASTGGAPAGDPSAAGAQNAGLPANAGAADPFAAANVPAPADAPVDAASAAPADPSAAPADPSAAPADAPAQPAVADNGGGAEPAAESEQSEATSASSIPGAAPENGSKMPYHIQKGDTLASIAAKVYGNKNKWQSLATDNNIQDASRIYAGDVLLYTVNNGNRSFAEKYEGAPRKQITVAKGDTLSGIAAKIYGTQSQWRTIWKENPQISNPDVLKVGTVITFRDTASVAMTFESIPVASVEMGE